MPKISEQKYLRGGASIRKPDYKQNGEKNKGIENSIGTLILAHSKNLKHYNCEAAMPD